MAEPMRAAKRRIRGGRAGRTIRPYVELGWRDQHDRLLVVIGVPCRTRWGARRVARRARFDWTGHKAAEVNVHV